jgi:molybdate transport system permease protein
MKPKPPVFLVAISLLMLAFLLLPVLVLLARGIQAAFTGVWHSNAVLQALEVSLWSSAICVALCVLLGLPVAFLLARYRFWGQDTLEALLDLPVMLPPVVAGLGLLLVFGRRGILGPGLELAGLELAFSPAAVVLAQLFVSAPYFIRAAKIGLHNIPPDLEGAAQVDGASWPQVLRLITLPLAFPALLEGLALCWARALGEFGATILFAGSLEGKTRTVTLQIYGTLESDLDGALFLSGLMSVLAFVLLFVIRRSSRSRFV